MKTMKKKLSKTIALTVAILLILSQSLCFAAETETAFDPINMTAEERMEWMANNAPVVYDGPAAAMTRSVVLSTDTKTTTVDSGGVDVGSMTTRVNYTCNDSLTVIESWSTDIFEAEILLSGTIKETNLTTDQVSSSQVRLMYETYFTRLEGVYYISHLYILWGDGTYSLQFDDYLM